MEIDSDGPRQMPAFFNPDGTYKVTHTYHNFAELMEKLTINKGRRMEDMKGKQYQYENNQRNFQTDQESIFQLAEMNGQLEKYFKLYQEMKFYTDVVLDCLNEKVS